MGVSPEGMIALIWFFLFFSLIFLIIRLYLVITRPRITKAAFASEVCICLAFTLFLVETAFTTAYQAALIRYRGDESVSRAIGMPRESLMLFFKFQLAEVEFYLTGIWLIKGSFIALYFDIFRSLPVRIKRGLQVTAVYTVLSWFANFLLPLVYCRPIKLVWAIEGHCTSFRSRLGTTFPMVTNVTTDLLIMIIPILVLRTLNLRRSEILAIGFLFCMGCLTIAATLLRYTYVTKRNAQGKDGNPNLITQAQIWSYAEGCIALIAACLPAGRVLLARKKRRRRTSDEERQKLGGQGMGLGRAETGEEGGGEHELVVFKSTSFAVDSTADLTESQSMRE